MADRYKRIFSLEPNLFKDGSPVLIRAGAVLSDSNTGRLLLQLKLENVSAKKISAVFTSVKCFNVAKESIEGVDDFQYLDLFIKRNVSFGEKTPIILPDSTTRSLIVNIKRVVFDDGEIWVNDGTDNFHPLPELIDVKHMGVEFAEQLEREANKKRPNFWGKFTNLPKQIDELWICACGSLNQNNEEKCFGCGFDKDWVFTFTSPEVLKPFLDEYKTEQAKAREIKQEQG